MKVVCIECGREMELGGKGISGDGCEVWWDRDGEMNVLCYVCVRVNRENMELLKEG